jgi:ABC-type Fe3+-siderophore transport system permease subunit
MLFQMPVCATPMLAVYFIYLLLRGISMTSVKPESLTLTGYIVSFVFVGKRNLNLRDSGVGKRYAKW